MDGLGWPDPLPITSYAARVRIAPLHISEPAAHSHFWSAAAGKKQRWVNNCQQKVMEGYIYRERNG